MPNPSPTVPFVTRDQLNLPTGTAFKLRVTTSSLLTAKAVTVQGMTKSGIFQFKIITASSNAPQTDDFVIPDVPVFVVVRDSGNSFWQGDCFVTMDIIANGDYLYHLGSGYIYGQKEISYPQVTNDDQRRSQGGFYFPTTTNPAANNEISESVSSLELWLVKSIRIQLTTDANAANRTVTLRVTTSGGSILLSIPPVAVQVASKTVNYTYAPGLNNIADATTLDQTIGFPQDFLMQESYKFVTVTTNRQVGDDFTAPNILVEKFILPS